VTAAYSPLALKSDRPIRIVALAVAAAILLLHVAAVVAVLDRPMHYDENEYLHASWLLAAGKRIYVDFFEDHSPHLFVLLGTVIPGGDLHAIDVLEWTRRARLLTALFGTCVVGLVMTFAWRATRDAAAVALAAGILLSSSQFWARGLCDVRAEAPTLALFWLGVVLLTWTIEPRLSQALRAGAGIGLLFFAALWNPKWPIESAVMGVYFLWYLWGLLRARWQLAVASLLAAVAVAAAALVPILRTASLSDYLFFTFRLHAASMGNFARAEWVKEAFVRAPLWTTTNPQFRWWWVVTALLIAAAALGIPRFRAQRPAADPRLALVAMALTVSALLEIRFVYAYPHVWAQYLVMLAAASAVLYPLAAGAIAVLVRSLVRSESAVRLLWIFAAAAVSIGLTALAALPLTKAAGGSLMWVVCVLAIVLAWIPTALAIYFAAAGTETHGLPALLGACAMGVMTFLALGPIVAAGLRPNPLWKTYWGELAQLQARTGREGTVFISPPRHPVAALDASYYWYSFREATPDAIRSRPRAVSSPLPALGFADFPPCRIAPNLRFVEAGAWMSDLDRTCECVESAWGSGQLKPAEPFAIFETNADPRSPVAPRAAQWAMRTAPLWRDFCSYGRKLDDRRFDALVLRYRR
jgi:hypothetical protein